MSKNYSQTGIGSPVEVTKGGPLIRNNAGVLENRNNADSAFSIMRGAPAVGNDDFVTLAQIGGGGATGATFTDSGVALEFTLADATQVSQVVANVSVRGTTGAISGELTTYQVICGSNGASISPASDIVQVDGVTPLSTVSLSIVQNVNDINLRFTRTGAGDTVQLFFSTQTLPLS